MNEPCEILSRCMHVSVSMMTCVQSSSSAYSAYLEMNERGSLSNPVKVVFSGYTTKFASSSHKTSLPQMIEKRHNLNLSIGDILEQLKQREITGASQRLFEHLFRKLQLV